MTEGSAIDNPIPSSSSIIRLRGNFKSKFDGEKEDLDFLFSLAELMMGRERECVCVG